MSEELYHQRLVSRARKAAGKGKLANPDASATADNPLCGDRVTVELKLAGGRIAELAHQTRGCLLCEAAAALIGELAPGETSDALRAAAASTRSLLDGAAPPAGRWAALEEFAPVSAVKSRRDCVLLPFDALLKALGAASKAAR